MSFVQVRVEDDLKENAIQLFDEIGMDLSTAIRLFLKKSVDEKKIPFSLDVKNSNENNDTEYSLKAHLKAPFNTDPFKIMEEFMKVCKDNGWDLLGGGVHFPYRALLITDIKDNEFYFGSLEKIEYINEDSTFSSSKEYAIGVGGKSDRISIHDKHIYFDDIKCPVYLYKIDEKITIEKDYIQKNDSLFKKNFELIAKRNIKVKLIDIYDESKFD